MLCRRAKLMGDKLDSLVWRGRRRSWRVRRGRHLRRIAIRRINPKTTEPATEDIDEQDAEPARQSEIRLTHIKDISRCRRIPCRGVPRCRIMRHRRIATRSVDC